MDVQLVVASGSKAGQAIPITGSKFIIGRADDCHLKPRSELISRYHCAIISEEGYVAVRDLGSKNGVFLNGERVTMEQELKNGDKLSLGPLEFLINLSVSAKAPKKPKVESVQDAVARTVEIQSGASQEKEDENDIGDWLSGSDEIDQDQETKTIEVSRGTLESFNLKEMPPPEKSPEKPGQQPSSRDAAANLLKNFFKGGK
ncbi:MAG TPA: hypothetical protein DEB39_04010 [Planctomycetaceae bacterium]|nr:hypothetical protein [Planctomycetaceae bacterium]